MRLRRELAERGLAGAAQTHQRDAALSRCVRLAEALRQHTPGLRNLRRRKPLELVDCQRQVDRPFGLITDDLGHLEPQGIRNLAQDEQGGIAGTSFQFCQIALRDTGCLGQDLA